MIIFVLLKGMRIPGLFTNKFKIMYQLLEVSVGKVVLFNENNEVFERPIYRDQNGDDYCWGKNLEKVLLKELSFGEIDEELKNGGEKEKVWFNGRVIRDEYGRWELGMYYRMRSGYEGSSFMIDKWGESISMKSNLWSEIYENGVETFPVVISDDLYRAEERVDCWDVFYYVHSNRRIRTIVRWYEKNGLEVRDVVINGNGLLKVVVELERR
jgi:hypothetical protein